MRRTAVPLGRRLLQLFSVLVVLLVAWTAPAGAQNTSLERADQHLLLSPTAGPPSTPLTVLGTGCAAGAPLAVSFDKQVIGTTTADGSGGFDTTVATPAAAVAGPSTITVAGPGCQESAPFEIQAGAVHDTFVGNTTSTLGQWEVAAGLLVLVAVLVVAIRRRRAANITEAG